MQHRPHDTTRSRVRLSVRLAVPIALSTGLVAGLVPASSPAEAATTTCAKYGTLSIGGGAYVYQQNEWNSDLTQCASVDQASGAWTITQASFGLPTDGAPATYPSVFRACHWGTCTSAGGGMPIQVSRLGGAPSSWSTTQVSSGAYDVAYDLWTNTTPTTSGQPDGSEIMVWLNSRGGVQPAGRIVATATIAGASWNVWTTRMSGWNYVAYQRTSGTTSVNGLDLAAFVRDSVSRGSTSSSWYLIGAEAGFEIWQGGQGLASNAFSFSASTATPGTDGSGGSGAGSVKVRYANDNRRPGDKQIEPGLRIVNTGSTRVSLSDVAVRYWFTRDGGAATFSTWCDYAAIGCGSVRFRVVNLATPRRGPDAYLRVTFAGGTLAPGASTGSIQVRFNKTDWSRFHETDDYSYGTSSRDRDAPRVTGYVNGTLVWGSEPS